MITIVLGRAVQFLLALAMLRAATTLLSPEEMGKVSLVLTTIAFYALFLVNPVGMFINRRLHAWQVNGTAKHYLIRYVGYLLAVALVAAISLSILFLQGWIDFGVAVGWLVFLVCGSLIFNTINQTAIPSLNLLGDSARFVWLSLITIAASFACAALFVHLGGPWAQSWLSGVVLGQALLGVVGVILLFRKLDATGAIAKNPIIQKKHHQALLRFAWPVAIAAGLGWVQGQGYRYILESQLGLAQLGLFVAGYSISAGVIAGLESVLMAYFQPRLYRDINENSTVENQAMAWMRYAKAVMPALLLSGFFIVALATEFTQIFLGKNFQLAADFVIWGALVETVRALVGVHSLMAHVHMRTRLLILPNLLGALVSIALCWVLIPRMGSVGVGVGLLTSGVVVLLAMHVWLVRRMGGGWMNGPLVLAGVGGVLFWALNYVLPQSLRESMGSVGVLVVNGLVYLSLQYILLSKHIAIR